MDEKELETPIKNDVTTEVDEKETFKEMSPARLILRRFFRSKLSLVGIIMIVGLFVFSFLGPEIYTKWGEEQVDRTEVVQQIPTTYTYINEDGVEVTVTQILEHTATINSYADPSSEHLKNR